MKRLNRLIDPRGWLFFGLLLSVSSCLPTVEMEQIVYSNDFSDLDLAGFENGRLFVFQNDTVAGFYHNEEVAVTVSDLPRSPSMCLFMIVGTAIRLTDWVDQTSGIWALAIRKSSEPHFLIHPVYRPTACVSPIRMTSLDRMTPKQGLHKQIFRDVAFLELSQIIRPGIVFLNSSPIPIQV
jgi:hypothetical protein